MAIFNEKLEILPKCFLHCHGNTPGYCQLNTVSNDAVYNYTKSQKVFISLL